MDSYLAFWCKTKFLFTFVKLILVLCFYSGKVSCIAWLAFLLGEGRDIMSHNIEQPLPSGRWDRARKTRPPLLAPKDHGFYPTDPVQQATLMFQWHPHNNLGIWGANALTLRPYLEPTCLNFECDVHDCCQAHSENKRLCICSTVTSEDLISYETLKDCLTAPIFKYRFYGYRDRDRQFLFLKLPSFKPLFSGDCRAVTLDRKHYQQSRK